MFFTFIRVCSSVFTGLKAVLINAKCIADLLKLLVQTMDGLGAEFGSRRICLLKYIGHCVIVDSRSVLTVHTVTTITTTTVIPLLLCYLHLAAHMYMLVAMQDGHNWFSATFMLAVFSFQI